MIEYLNKRIKELDDEQIDAIVKGDAGLATKLSFAICELLDAKNEYQNQQRELTMAKLKCP